MKKILAFVMAMAMVLGMGVTAFATEGDDDNANPPAQTTPVLPAENDVATATVTNVEVGSIVTAYQIVQAKYNNGFTGYEVVSKGTDGKAVVLGIANAEAPTPTEVVSIASNTTLLSKLKSVTLNAKTKVVEGETVEDLNADGTVDYTGSLNAGYWLVLVTGAADKVYNPMLVGVYYSVSGSDNTMESENLDSTSNWVLNGSTVYAKSTEPSIDKQIVDKDGNATSDYDVAIGDTVYFQIDTAIPSYSDEYTDSVVTIKDELSTGLKLNQSSIKVFVDGKEVRASADKYEIRDKSDTGFTIEFKTDYVLGDANGKDIKVKYDAELTESANWNFNPNTNTATLEYTNNPDTDANDRTGSTDDKTYTYTFGIGVSLYGETEETWNTLTELLRKGEIIQTTVEGVTTTTTNPLEGAVFTLTNNATKKVYTSTESSKKGFFGFKGLDAGTYTLVEKTAPEGYSLSTQEYEVVISADYNNDGTLNKYTISIDGVATTYTAQYDSETDSIKNITVETVKSSTETVQKEVITDIPNTKVPNLPSTGGIGTTIFTIGGCAIMIVAAGLFFASRRKSTK